MQVYSLVLLALGGYQLLLIGAVAEPSAEPGGLEGHCSRQDTMPFDVLDATRLMQGTAVIPPPL